MNWLTVFQSIGVFAVASGLLAWLIKSLVGHSLSRDLEVFKASLGKAHAIELEQVRNRFTVGATSHMADVAFDKHVQFCEEYAQGVNAALLTMLRKGPHKNMLESSIALGAIRTKWILWVVPEMVAKLGKFESDLTKIGANFQLLEHVPGDADAINEAYRIFAEVMGWEWKGKAPTKDVAASTVYEGLQKLLGINELTRLRTEFIHQASDNLKA